MDKDFTNEAARYIRKALGDALEGNLGRVKVKAMAPEEIPTNWLTMPVEIFKQMISAVRGEDEDKPLPHSFEGGQVIMAARIPFKPVLPRHQAIIVREYESSGVTEYSVHYLVAQWATEPWHSDLADYGIPTREKAFDNFTERMYARGKLSRDR